MKPVMFVGFHAGIRGLPVGLSNLTCVRRGTYLPSMLGVLSGYYPDNQSNASRRLYHFRGLTQRANSNLFMRVLWLSVY